MLLDHFHHHRQNRPPKFVINVILKFATGWLASCYTAATFLFIEGKLLSHQFASFSPNLIFQRTLLAKNTSEFAKLQDFITLIIKDPEIVFC